MAMKNLYFSLHEEILGKSSAGDYMRDALGSVTGTTSPTNRAVLNRDRYAPYGTRTLKTGVGVDAKFQWVGTAGYRDAALAHCGRYVRARHYANEEGRWTTVDPLWPDEKAYIYVGGRVATRLDSSGTYGIDASCKSCHTSFGRTYEQQISSRLDRFCSRMRTRSLVTVSRGVLIDMEEPLI